MILENNSLNEFFFARFKDGDELAFEHIFKSKFNQIAGFCDQFISSHDDAQNMAQEAFLNLWLNRKKIEKPSGINSFLYTFAKSACLNFIRHQQVVEKYSSQALNEKEQLLNSEVLESFDFNSIEITELDELIQKSISTLPEKCRLVFIKKRFEGKMNKEIAEELGINVKSVEANMTRAIKALKASLSEYLPAILVLFIVQ
ncbi:RNA polymerase sigma-70 factor [uncultured Draconibacterium sp.]|uniref:RNA polymerase sigma-70 factor n=1 Tax=uncultured Draconibacterium sp. TaxID=1573823 RepID=UPI00321794CB